MNICKSRIVLLLVLVFVCSSFLFSQELVIKQQIAGPIKTNCYLLYDAASKEAALIDVGGPVDELLQIIEKEGLALKYILITHGHIDHLEGIPEIKKKFPSAKLCLTKADYDDFLLYQDWCRQNVDKSETAKFMLTTPEFKKWFEYDIKNFIKPDVFIEEGQVFNLGGLEIKTLSTPGHSRGSVSYLVNGSLFSGDLLFIKGTGVIDMLGSSQEDFDKTFKKLSEIIPDNTMIYRGHGKSFDFGTGKKENWWTKP
jgi:hydroxyacylglutathione hydrolase